MTLSLQAISDRIELEDLLHAYTDCIDTKSFDGLRNIFTEDAHVDYSATGGAVGDLESTIRFLKEALTIFPATQHMMGNIRLEIAGDKATGRSICLNPMCVDLDGQQEQFFLGFWYEDEFLRTQRAGELHGAVRWRVGNLIPPIFSCLRHWPLKLSSRSLLGRDS